MYDIIKMSKEKQTKYGYLDGSSEDEDNSGDEGDETH